MEIITVEEKISLHPKYISSNINKYLYDKLNTDYKNKCLQKSGYILEIYPDFTILNNNIYSSTHSIILDVRLSMKVLKPEVGTKLNVNILHVLKNGILTECQNVLKIFIPSINIKNMNFDSLKNCFTDNNNISITRSDTIEIEISKVRYENNKFDCIGLFIQKDPNIITINEKTEIINQKSIVCFNNQYDLAKVKEIKNQSIKNNLFEKIDINEVKQVFNLTSVKIPDNTKDIEDIDLHQVKEVINLVEIKDIPESNDILLTDLVDVKEKIKRTKKTQDIEVNDLAEVKEVKEKKKRTKKTQDIEVIDLAEVKEVKEVKEKKKRTKKTQDIEVNDLAEVKEVKEVKEKKKRTKKTQDIEVINLAEVKEKKTKKYILKI